MLIIASDITNPKPWDLLGVSLDLDLDLVWIRIWIWNVRYGSGLDLSTDLFKLQLRTHAKKK
jgi:hypothetical protein